MGGSVGFCEEKLQLFYLQFSLTFLFELLQNFLFSPRHVML